MDYVLYTSEATYWTGGGYTPRTVEIVFYRDAGNCSVIDEVFGPNDTLASVSFWLGASADNGASI